MADADVVELKRTVAALAARVAALEAVIKASGNAVNIVSPGALTITAATNLEILAGANASYVSGASLAMTTGAAASFTIGGSYAMAVGGSGRVQFGSAYALAATTALSFTSDHGFSVASKDIALAAGATASLEAKNLHVKALKQTTRTHLDFVVQTKDFTVDASGKASIKSSGELTLKGSKIAQN